jgi:hypothetical protein
MKLPWGRAAVAVIVGASCLAAGGQQPENSPGTVIAQPPGVSEDIQNLSSEHAAHTAFTFDHDMLQSANGLLNGGEGSVGELNSVTFETYRYREPAFYIPEAMHALVAAYRAAGWKHLVDQHPTPRDSATPVKPLTDLWLHFHGTDIDGVTALVRAPREMTVVEVSGELKPLELLRLGGHFGIPKIDPGAVMVPAPPGR